MPPFSVVWEIDIEADSPEEAAETARYYQTVLGTTATVFEVRDMMGKITWVDLLDNEEQTEEHSSQMSPSAQRRNRCVRERKQNLIPVRVTPDKEITLSPGEHSELIRAVVEEFGSRFVPGGVLIYA
ncbi:MAG: BsuBI/PstI family type II restriction endonuclease, partial [Acidobacteriaceae bacterium]